MLSESCTKALHVKVDPSKLSMKALPLRIACQLFWLLRVEFFKVTTKALPLWPRILKSCKKVLPVNADPSKWSMKALPLRITFQFF